MFCLLSKERFVLNKNQLHILTKANEGLLLSLVANKVGAFVLFRLFGVFLGAPGCPGFFCLVININRSVIKSSNSEKSLGISIDIDFTFEERINTYQIKIKQTTTKGQELLQSGTFFMKKWGKRYCKVRGYYNVGQLLLQSGTGMTELGNYYKLGQNKPKKQPLKAVFIKLLQKF